MTQVSKQRSLKKIALAILLCGAFFPGCGGGGDGGAEAAAPIEAVKAVHQLHAIVRPDENGRWFIQDDVDHTPVGIVGVSQTSEYLEVVFSRSYSHAGSVQVTPDDDLNGYVTAGSNLGLSAMRIRLKVNGVQIDPANIYSYGPAKGSGNLWVNVTMVQQ